MDLEDDYIEYTTEELHFILEGLRSTIQEIRKYGLERIPEVLGNYISDETNYTPERRIDIILERRGEAIVFIRKIEDTLSLKINMDNEQIIEKIEEWLIDNGKTERLILDCDFPILKKLSQLQGIAFVLGQYFTYAAAINECNKLLTSNGTEGSNVKTIDNTKKIKQILTAIRQCFTPDDHLDLIVKALVECLEEKEYSQNPKRAFANYENINDFYYPFVQVWKETGLTPDQIGTVLCRHLFMHNGKAEAIHPRTVRKNIYISHKRMPIVTDRNKP